MKCTITRASAEARPDTGRKRRWKCWKSPKPGDSHIPTARLLRSWIAQHNLNPGQNCQPCPRSKVSTMFPAVQWVGDRVPEDDTRVAPCRRCLRLPGRCRPLAGLGFFLPLTRGLRPGLSYSAASRLLRAQSASSSDFGTQRRPAAPLLARLPSCEQTATMATAPSEAPRLSVTQPSSLAPPSAD